MGVVALLDDTLGLCKELLDIDRGLATMFPSVMAAGTGGTGLVCETLFRGGIGGGFGGAFLCSCRKSAWLPDAVKGRPLSLLLALLASIGFRRI